MKQITITLPDDATVSVSGDVATTVKPPVTAAPAPTPTQGPVDYTNPTVAPNPPPATQQPSQSVLETLVNTAMQTRNGQQYNGKLQSRISPLTGNDLAFSYASADVLASAAANYNGHVLLILPDRSIRAIKNHPQYPFPIDYYVMVPSGAVERCDQYGRVNEELRNAQAGTTEPLPYYGSIDLLMAGLLNIGFQYAVKVGNETVWTGFGPAVQYRLQDDGSVVRVN